MNSSIQGIISFVKLPTDGNPMANVDRVFADVFASQLGWMAMVGGEGRLYFLSFGHFSAEEAWKSLSKAPSQAVRRGRFDPQLVDRLQMFVEMGDDEFLDVEVELSHLSPFGQRVIRHCRRIPPGETRTYGELAAKAGSPAAARAVGNVMASNRCPLVIPCHRVVAADGRLGGFSAVGGVQTKRRLLTLERAAVEKFALAEV